MPVRYPGVPPALAQAPLRTVRPRDVDVYANPRKELVRLENRGLVHRLAEGFYTLVPQDRVDGDWMPTLEGAAAGIGAAEFGAAQYALMGLTAARLHRVIPRAIAVAVIAAPRRRETLHLADRPATIQFFVRDITNLQLEMMQTDLGDCLVTTPEQTVLDLAHLPRVGEMEHEALAAIHALLPRCNPDVMTEIAAAQRLREPFNRVRKMAL
jgi:predicted transcriptional regulator of viral defense system